MNRYFKLSKTGWSNGCYRFKVHPSEKELELASIIHGYISKEYDPSMHDVFMNTSNYYRSDIDNKLAIPTYVTYEDIQTWGANFVYPGSVAIALARAILKGRFGVLNEYFALAKYVRRTKPGGLKYFGPIQHIEELEECLKIFRSLQ